MSSPTRTSGATSSATIAAAVRPARSRSKEISDQQKKSEVAARGRAACENFPPHCFGWSRYKDPLTRSDLAGRWLDGSRGSPRPSLPVPARSSSRPAASTRHAGSRFRWRWAWPSWPGRAGVVPALRAAPPPNDHRGGSRPGKTMWWVAALPARVVSPPAPVGGAGRVKEKGIAAAAAGRGPRRPVGPEPATPARPALLAGCGRHRAGRIHCISEIVNVSIPHAGVAKKPQKTRDFRGFRLEAIGRIVVYWCSVRGHRGPEMKVARAGARHTRGAESASY